MVEYKPLPFEEAIKFFKDKIVLTPEQYKTLEDAVKARAFTVSGLAEADILMEVYDEILSALKTGMPFSAFKTYLLPRLMSAGWGEEAPYRLDTIFRTNIQSMYQAGHYKQQMEIVDERPYWQYVAVMDSRTRPSHAARNGKVFRADDPWWNANYPMIGIPFDWWNCRCTVRTLSGREVEREGLNIEKKQSGAREDLLSAWNPDMSKYPDWLREKIKG